MEEVGQGEMNGGDEAGENESRRWGRGKRLGVVGQGTINGGDGAGGFE
jgi:hypothetical protein